LGAEHGGRRGLSAEEVAGRRELEWGEETIGDSSGKEATAGPGPPAVGIQVLGVPPGIFADKAAPYRAQQAQADAVGEATCHLGAPVVEMFVSLTGIHYDGDGWWWDLRYRDLRPIDRASA
jgi:hypothetical protein